MQFIMMDGIGRVLSSSEGICSPQDMRRWFVVQEKVGIESCRRVLPLLRIDQG